MGRTLEFVMVDDREIQGQLYGRQTWNKDRSDTIVAKGLLLGEILEYYRRLKGNLSATTAPAKYPRGNK